MARERDRLRILLEITNALVSELDIRELFSPITSSVRRAVPHEYTSLVLVDPAGAARARHASLKATSEFCGKARTAPIEGTPAGQAVEPRRAVLFDADALRRFPAPVNQEPGGRRNPVGVLRSVDLAARARYVERRQRARTAFTQEDVDLLARSPTRSPSRSRTPWPTSRSRNSRTNWPKRSCTWKTKSAPSTTSKRSLATARRCGAFCARWRRWRPPIPPS